MRFSAPVAHVYNPLVYARGPILQYFRKYGASPREILFLGMNPGPFGMVQTGIPFGEVRLVQEYLHIDAVIEPPASMHPKRPVMGYACPRSEVSGRRLWSWVQNRYPRAEDFFEKHFVANYCPLAFMEPGGKNITPDKMNAVEAADLFRICDAALRDLVGRLQVCRVIGVGQFARKRAELALAGMDLRIDAIPHPSPANPAANRGWDAAVDLVLSGLGLA
ncbi:MAG: single-stranded DNA-binding protein [Deltaproteobacteria bacterium HGW-Deltaproteobacteria-17]|nr:MAG: single-stranded DNA-binding protein [Deltaproteobacteria bacterium HGW-Deltaproteobacteria-17]